MIWQRIDLQKIACYIIRDHSVLELVMNEYGAKITEKPVKAYVKPEVRDLGKVGYVTKNVNVVGGNDSQFSVLDPS